MSNNKFDEFFAVHSQNVDNADSLGFWALTDQLLEFFLMESMDRRDNVHVVDFGGGTGRWLKKLDKYFTNSLFTIVDLSDDMLAQAKKKVDNKQFTNHIELIKSDISDITKMPSESADYVISTYNPLSFVEEPQLAINEAFRVLKPGGKALITVQGYYNALYSKLNGSIAEGKELLSIFKNKKVTWNPTVPPLWQLPQSDIEGMFAKAGFSNIASRGIATIIQPQPEDFDPENKQLGPISKKLNEDKEFFDAVLEIEKSASRDQQAINRAMNILTIGQRG
jgi:SAM-dependent methyltransferase